MTYILIGVWCGYDFLLMQRSSLGKDQLGIDLGVGSRSIPDSPTSTLNFLNSTPDSDFDSEFFEIDSRLPDFDFKNQLDFWFKKNVKKWKVWKILNFNLWINFEKSLKQIYRKHRTNFLKTWKRFRRKKKNRIRRWIDNDKRNLVRKNGDKFGLVFPNISFHKFYLLVLQLRKKQKLYFHLSWMYVEILIRKY